MSSNFFVSQNPFLSISLEANQTAQILGQWATLSESQLTALVGSFAKQASDLSLRHSIYVIATVATLTLTGISYLVTQHSDNAQVKRYSYPITFGTLLLFIFSASAWLDTYLKISNANLWHERALEVLNASV